jgi:hypothetical protein
MRARIMRVRARGPKNDRHFTEKRPKNDRLNALKNDQLTVVDNFCTLLFSFVIYWRKILKEWEKKNNGG